jgi:hypothetical protein
VAAVTGSREGGRARLWFGALGAPIAWALHFVIAYPLVEWACRTGSTFALWASFVVAAIAIVASGAAALSLAREPGDDRTAARRRFMGRSGLLLALLLLFALAAEWAPLVGGDPCVGWGEPAVVS